MKKFSVTDGMDGWKQDVDAATAYEAIEIVACGICAKVAQYGEPSIVLRLSATRTDCDEGGVLVEANDRAERIITIDPVEPHCEIGDARYFWHEWQLRSLQNRENGDIVVEFCRNCGIHRTTNMSAMFGAEEGVIATTQYDQPDEETLLRIAKIMITTYAHENYATEQAALCKIMENHLDDETTIAIANDLRNSDGKQFCLNGMVFNRE